MGKRIVAFGEVVWDILPNGRVLGGTPSNMVFRCNSFGDEGFLLSSVGNDELGIAALKRLEELGIINNNVQVDPVFPTGTVNISFDEKGESIFDVTPDVAFDHIEFSAEALKLARNADCLFFGLLPQRFGLSKNTLRELIKEADNSIKFFDLKLFEHFFDPKIVENLLKCSNIVRIKEKEISFLCEKLGFQSSSLEDFGFNFAQKYKLDKILVTRGNLGVFAFDSEHGSFYDSGYQVEMIDNIGSGMAFCAGFLHCILHSETTQAALNFGNAAGALNATKRGATSFFDKKDVSEFLKKNLKGKSIL